MHGYLGFVALDATLTRHLQLANGNTPVEADDPPTFRIYGDGDTPVASGTLSAEVDTQTGLHKLEQACTTLNAFARGTYSLRVAYAVSTVAKVQSYTFTVV
ncbi:MAG: hypothetical protein C0483_18700 [Pirellula sp.]|nr:hypothetical protein [Pirellula sp.]